MRIRYLITDPKHYPDSVSRFAVHLKRNALRGGATHLLYRDKTGSFSLRKALALKRVAENIGAVSVLSADPKRAKRFGFDAVHLTSRQFALIKSVKNGSLGCIVSCHTPKEVKRAFRLGADMVTFSPIFETPGKGAPKGIKSLRRVVLGSSKGVIALGGIVSRSHIEQIFKTRAIGFASIRYFVSTKRRFRKD